MPVYNVQQIREKYSRQSRCKNIAAQLKLPVVDGRLVCQYKLMYLCRFIHVGWNSMVNVADFITIKIIKKENI